MGLLFNFSKEKNPGYDKGMKGLNDKINQIIKDIPSYQAGGTLVGAPYSMGGTLNANDIMKRMNMVPFYDKNSYQSGGIISGETIIPSTALDKFSQNGNIVRPNGVVINRSQQAIRNQKLI